MPPRSRTTSNRRSSSPRRAETPAEAGTPAPNRAPTAMIDLPYLHAELAVPGAGVNVKAGPINIAIPSRYLYYGGVGALAVAGAVEWPIAGALAATGVLVDRLRKPRADASDASAADKDSAPAGAAGSAG